MSKKTNWKNIIGIALIVLFTGGAIYYSFYDYFAYERPSNPSQDNFDRFLDAWSEREYDAKNDIQEKEFYTAFEKSISRYVDSIGLLLNWCGEIVDIKIVNCVGEQLITFTISYQPEEYRKVIFRCSHLIEPDQQNDRLYNIVKNIANRSKVYFDGFIGTRQNGDIIYYGSSPGNRLNISYPDYSFWIVDIGTEKRSDTLSPDMQKAVSLIYEITALVERRYFERISQEEYDKQSDPLVKSFTALKERMSPDEQWYIQRLTNCLGNRIIDRAL